MDSNDWRPPQSDQPPSMDGADWRSLLQPDSRQRIVNKIMETLKRHLPFSGPEGLQELRKIAVRFEEKIYHAATSQTDYLRKISLKMLTMESKSQNPLSNAMPSNSTGAAVNQNPQDSASLDSTAQTSGTTTGDWQEEVYQKFKTMKDLYYSDLSEMHQKISMKMQQNDSLPQPTKSESLDKLRMFKNMVEKFMHYLEIPKSSIVSTHKEKLLFIEKHIANLVNLLNTHRPRKPVPSMQQGQLLPPQLQSMEQPQQPQSQIPQPESHEGGANSQLQSMNLQGSVASLQQSNVPILSVKASTQQSNGNSIQISSNTDSGQQGNAPSPMQQNPVSVPQQTNMASLQAQSGVNMLQQNINVQTNSIMHQNQHLKQQQEQHLMQSNQLKQQLQSRQMHQQLLQKHHMMQQQQQQPQLHQQQAKLQQMQVPQMPQLHQMNDVNELKMRQGLGLKPGAFPQNLPSTQRYAHQQLKPGASFPISSPQILQAMSPQINQHSSPHTADHQNLPPKVTKTGTPLQSANSPFALSPSSPAAPSPMPGDSEKLAVSSLSNPTSIGHQQTNGPSVAPQSLLIGTPGMSASPFLGNPGPDAIHGNVSAVSEKSSVTEQPLQRLLKAFKTISPKALDASVGDMESVVSMMDRIAGSAPGNGSRATIGEDLVALKKKKSSLQEENKDLSNHISRMKFYGLLIGLFVGFCWFLLGC